MRERRQAARVRDGLDDRGHAGPASGDEGGTVVAEQPIERVAAIDGVPGRDQCVGDERAAHTSAARRRRRREQDLDVDGAVQRLETEADLLHPLDASQALRLKESIEALVVRVEEIAQDVDVASAIDRRHLDAVDEAKAERVRRPRALRRARRGCRDR